MLYGMVVPWHTEFERMGVRFVFSPESLSLPDDLATIKLLVNHDDDRPAGYAVEAAVDSDGLRMAFALPDHARSVELLAEIEAGLRDGFSVGVAPTSETMDLAWDILMQGNQTTPVEMAGVLREVSSVAVPQFNNARVNNSTQLVTLSQEETVMTDPVMPTIESAAARFTITEAPEFAELAGRVTRLESGTPSGRHPLAAFASLSDVMRAGLSEEMGRIRLALADNTGNAGANAGVLPPAWASTVHGIIQRRRSAVEAFGGAVALPDAGMDTAWPYFDGDLTALVGNQATHKAEITSAAVDIKKGTAPVKTYAGGADNALQIIERSDPAFLEAWGRIMLAAYGVITDNAFTAAVATAATGTAPIGGALATPLTATAEEVRAFLFEASDVVDDATGAPAEFCLAAPDVFRYWGSLVGLHNPEYGTQNAAGTASARTLVINVNGLPVIKARGLASAGVLVSNTDAAKFREDGPSFIDTLNVAKLGRDSAVYGFGATEVYAPAGVVEAVSGA
jgi:HK97 family phage prohead protease